MGILLGFPVFLYELWKFIESALFKNERKIVLLVVPASCLMFYIGMGLALLGVAPAAIKFLIQFGSATLKPMISIQAYLSFLFWMVFGFGLLFQLPIIVVVLVRGGIVKAQTLAHYRRHVAVVLLVIAAVLTPGPDIFSQLILTIPTYLLFEMSLLVARRMEK